MKRIYLFFVFFFLLINLQGQSTKVIIDADTGNEIDDLPAIVLVLKSDKIDVLALTAAQIDTRLKPNDRISDLLRERWNDVNKDSNDWIMWDFAIVHAVINPQFTKQVLRKTPPENTLRKIYIYTEINSEAMMEEFWKVFLK